MMGKYLRTINNYPPYALMKDKRGFISRLYGNGHTGVDSVGNQWANPVCAICDGTVLQAYISASLGKVVQYGAGRVKIAYYHLATISVKVGQKVTTGKTQIGIEGGTGALADGKHLHVSIWIDGVLVDPLPYLTGAKKLPVMQQSQINNALTGAHEGEKYMIRKVTKALNLRSTRSLANNSNLVYKDMPVGTVFLVTDTVKEGGVTWGKVLVTINGRTYAGWSNIATTWSVEV